MVFSCPDYCFGISIGVIEICCKLDPASSSAFRPALPKHAQAHLHKKLKIVDVRKIPDLLIQHASYRHPLVGFKKCANYKNERHKVQGTDRHQRYGDLWQLLPASDETRAAV